MLHELLYPEYFDEDDKQYCAYRERSVFKTEHGRGTPLRNPFEPVEKKDETYCNYLRHR